MIFSELMVDAKTNAESQQQILEMYKSLLIKESICDGIYDEDLYQELAETLLRCIRTFAI